MTKGELADVKKLGIVDTDGFRTASSSSIDYNTSTHDLNVIFGYYNSAMAGTSTVANTSINLNADMHVNRLGFANNDDNTNYVTTITTTNDSTIYMGRSSAGDGFCYRAWWNGKGSHCTFDVNFEITPIYSTEANNKADKVETGSAIFRLGTNSLTIGSASNIRDIYVNNSSDNRRYNFVHMLQYSGQKQVFDLYANITSIYSKTLYFYAGTATAKCIVNFRGDGNNKMVDAVFDCGIFNLLKDSGYNAMEATLSIRYDAIVNIWTEGVLDNTTSINAGGSYNGVSGTINLNGGSLKVSSSINMNSAASGDRAMIIDFGMTRSGMTAAETAAQGIANINLTGENNTQVLYLKKIANMGASYVNTSYINILNFYTNKFGNDSIIIGSDHAVDDSVLTNNGIRIDINPYQQILDDFYGDGIYELSYGKSETYGYWIVKEQISGGEYDGMFSYDLAFSDAVEALFAPIPEPSTVAALAGLAALGFAFVRRRK